MTERTNKKIDISLTFNMINWFLLFVQRRPILPICRNRLYQDKENEDVLINKNEVSLFTEILN